MNDWTWGYEVEWGDINRTLNIPKHLGKWEYSETDILNLNSPYKYVACDPLGKKPIMGGEINTVPTKTWLKQIDKIMELYDYFTYNGNTPTASCISHSHIHLHIPNLINNINKLKKLMLYIKDNQELTIQSASNFISHPAMKKLKNCTMYLKYDGGRKMPDFMIDNIIKLSTDFNSFIRQHCTGRDGVSMGRPFRYAVNTYSLKHTKTIEFRFFRATTLKHEIHDMFLFVEKFMSSALGNQKPVSKILSEYDFRFPQLNFNVNQWKGYLATKYDKSRGVKKRDGFIPI